MSLQVMIVATVAAALCLVTLWTIHTMGVSLWSALLAGLRAPFRAHEHFVATLFLYDAGSGCCGATLLLAFLMLLAGLVSPGALFTLGK